MGYGRLLNESRGDLVENPLSVGEVVKLRGSRSRVRMVVEEVEGGGSVKVVWQDELGVLHEGQEFRTGVLERVGGRGSFFGLRR